MPVVGSAAIARGSGEGNVFLQGNVTHQAAVVCIRRCGRTGHSRGFTRSVHSEGAYPAVGDHADASVGVGRILLQGASVSKWVVVAVLVRRHRRRMSFLAPATAGSMARRMSATGLSPFIRGSGAKAPPPPPRAGRLVKG